MHASRSLTLIAVALTGMTLASPVHAQTSFKVADRDVHAHGSFQQGFVWSGGNNFLTMDTTEGSVAMTDAAFNLSTNVTSKLRLGAQVYGRNIGELGDGRPQVDWAFGDYRFHQSFGIRAGKVKTALGLFNDTQDMEFLHTWALLPQAVYPLDLRSVTIAHVGADAYGTVRLGGAGSFSYVAYAGVMQDDSRGGYRYGVEDRGLGLGDSKHRGGGFDTRWSTPVDGLTAGYSFLQTRLDADLTVPMFPVTLELEISPWRRHALFADYQTGPVRFSAEWRRDGQKITIVPSIGADSTVRSAAWFTSGSYRLNSWLEMGLYHSRFVADRALPSSLDSNHIYDTAIAGRIDLNRFWNVKVEGHFMDGFGDPINARGFYTRNNQQGFDPTTRLLVVRTSVSF